MPCVVDLAAMRDGIVALGGDPQKVNPLQPVELVIDHSVQSFRHGQRDVTERRARIPSQSRALRVPALGQTAGNFRVVPPETGIVHQVNIEYLARVVCRDQTEQGRRVFRHGVRDRLAHDDGERSGGVGASAALKPRRPCSASRC